MEADVRLFRFSSLSKLGSEKMQRKHQWQNRQAAIPTRLRHKGVSSQAGIRKIQDAIYYRWNAQMRLVPRAIREVALNVSL